MTKRMLLTPLLVLVACGALAGTAAGKGVGWMAAPGGVTVGGSDHRYIAISPGRTDALTVVAQVDQRGGRLSRWWHLPGGFQVPAVAYDGTAGGLSADGGTLVLSAVARIRPPRLSKFAIIHPQRSQRRRGRGHPPGARPFRFVVLRGSFSFDAISPDGSTVYLIRYPGGGGESGDYELRAMDAKSGTLLPQPIVDPDEAGEPMQGLPYSRTTSPDGRWSYTLYAGEADEPFIHALDTVGRRAVCIDLPQLKQLDARFFYLLHLQLREGGRELVLLRHRLGPADAVPLLAVDTESFEVGKPGLQTVGAATGPPWTPIGLAVAALLLALAWQIGRKRKQSRGQPLERA